MRFVPGIVLLAIAFQNVAGVAQTASANATVIRHVTVVDVSSGSLLSDQDVLIVGTRIAAVTPSTASKISGAAQIVEGRGRF